MSSNDDTERQARERSGFIKAVRVRVLTGDKPKNICPKCGAYMAQWSATAPYGCWGCYNEERVKK